MRKIHILDAEMKFDASKGTLEAKKEKIEKLETKVTKKLKRILEIKSKELLV